MIQYMKHYETMYVLPEDDFFSADLNLLKISPRKIWTCGFCSNIKHPPTWRVIFDPVAGEFVVHKQEAGEEGEGEGANRVQSWVQRIQYTLDKYAISIKHCIYLFVMMFSIHGFASILSAQRTSILC